MLVTIVNDARAYLFDVFVAKFDIWLALGLGGQLLFASRWIVQWWASEKSGKAVVPLSFWVLSLVGGLSVLVYGLTKRDPVIILGQLPAIGVYTRNLVLIARERRERSGNPA